ncbi:MAG TPA: lysophospholipid acyltransferase family protein [Trebonia sp.]|nr:lysophospholipid acyltransferase family protein [Trebonia sp.]
MGEGRASRLLRSLEGVAYWAAVAPALARLPAALGYRLACRRGDWEFRTRPHKRADLEGNLRQLLGEEISEHTAKRLARQWFRFASCQAIDAMRLRGRGRALGRLVEIRGREHLEAALAGGKGAILCSAHFGSYDCAFSLLGASGFPVTIIGRWQHKYTAGMSSAERRFWDLVFARRVRRHRRRPNIEPWAGRVQVAVQAAAVLRANEVVTIAIDAPPLSSDMARTVEAPFLGRQAKLLPGAVTLARLTGAPLLMCFMYRSADYRHQVLEISAPVELPAEDDAATAFARCTAEVSAAIKRSPAQWAYMASRADLADLGLIPPDGSAEPSKTDGNEAPPVKEPVILIDKGFSRDGSADSLAARG